MDIVGRLLKSKDHKEPFYWDGQAYYNLDKTLRFDKIRSDGDFFIVPTFVEEYMAVDFSEWLQKNVEFWGTS